MANKIKITSHVVKKLPIPSSGYVIYWADDLVGFGVRVTSSGVKSYIVQHRVNRRDRRITIGRHDRKSATGARNEAKKRLGLMADGQDPVVEREKVELKNIGLSEAFSSYIESHTQLSAGTIADMQDAFKHLADWKDKPLIMIRGDDIVARHRKIGDKSRSRADAVMRYLRAIFNYSMKKYKRIYNEPLIFENPVNELSEEKSWYNVKRRKTVIKAHQLKDWFDGVMQLRSDTARDFLMLVLLTGLRKREAAKLTWDHVDLVGHTLSIVDPKNKNDFDLPLSDYLVDMLKSRKEDASSIYVFPGTGQQGHYLEPRGAIQRVAELSKIDFCIHDLRRTFTTAAENLDISVYTIKRLVNHKEKRSDVTEGYVVSDVERLRNAMQQITNYILKKSGQRPTAEIVAIHDRRARA